jgi:prevent-host-death family protein
MNVATKTLKNRLSYYLRLVRGGESVTVTDRGVAVAELRAVSRSGERQHHALTRLADEGALTLGTGHVKPFKAVRLARGLHLSTAVLDDRE